METSGHGRQKGMTARAKTRAVSCHSVGVALLAFGRPRLAGSAFGCVSGEDGAAALSLRVDLSVAGFLAGAAFIGVATAAPSVGSLAKEASTIAGVCAAAFAARFAVGLGAFATLCRFLGDAGLRAAWGSAA